MLGNVIEEFMDVSPEGEPARTEWNEKRERINTALRDNGLSYFRFGRVLPDGELPSFVDPAPTPKSELAVPTKIFELLDILVRGLPRAMWPLTNRRKGSMPLSFNSEYDIQDLLHAQLRPWIKDIRPEEVTPSYAGTSTRMDFLLPAQRLVLETKLVRDSSHGKRIGDELILDIEHYRSHPHCSFLWCVVYDPNRHIQNPGGLTEDLEGERVTGGHGLAVRVFVQH